MMMPQGWDYNFDEKLSDDEYEVINKFLASYRNQKIIVADEYRQDFNRVTLKEPEITFKKNEDIFKSFDFYREIYHQGNQYIVKLGLWHADYMEFAPEYLEIREFGIIKDGKVHFINLDTKNATKSNWLFNIISIFNEKKIISPEQAYCKRMYTDKALQKFITNHEWRKIAEGISQMPTLANALFIIKDGYESRTNFTADFGTILYQLISYRQNNLHKFNREDLMELDKLIVMLRNTELLKVQLHEQIGGSKFWPTSSILLESNSFDSRMHSSKQYNVTNATLSNEKKVLNERIKVLKKQQKN